MPLIALAAQASAVDAERAFASMAQRRGQWTAFRRYAAEDAIMFTPDPTDAQAFLEPLRNPPTSVQWWPAESYVACDGSFAVNTGPWARTGGGAGYFTTVWRRGAAGDWRWIYDAGDGLPAPIAAGERPRLRRASCRGTPDDALGAADPGAARQGDGHSADRTLQWRWTMSAQGARAFDVYVWNGREMERVIEDRVAAPVAAR